jgi:protein TonB
LDEIVFENRNKEYGAFDLRSRYPKILTKAFIIGTLAFVLLALGPFIVMKIKQMNEKDKEEVNAKLIDILDEPIVELPKEEEPPPPPPPKEIEPPKVEIIQNVVPEPKKAPKVETPPPPISVQIKTTTGVVAQEGVKAPAYAPPPPPPSTGTKAAAVQVKPQVDEKKVYTEVEQLAEFPGGLNAFRNKVNSSFDQSIMEGDEGTVRTEVTFVVERDGNITDVNATGSNKAFNEEAKRTVRSINNKWTPAKVNGQNVRYRYRLPIAMQFDY